MYISSININCFRNIHKQSLQLTSSFNIFIGENGAGKTSLLEAIYYLGMGRSFRTHLNSRVVEHTQPSLMLTGSVIQPNTHKNFVGIERMRGGERTIKLNREIQSSIAPVAQVIPLQLISVDSYRYFSDGPKERRSFLDWGVFHMNSEFLSLWQSYNRVLKQRNTALKNNLPQSEVSIWNNEYVCLSEDIDALRTIYIDEFTKIYNDIFLKLLPCFNNAEIRYKRGWMKDRALNSLLNEHFTRDSAFGYSQDGPHRADLQLYIDKCPADDILSQGQLKLAAYALHLAQGVLLKQQTDKTPIYLIDDLPSELDTKKQALVLEIIKELNAQVFITAITADTLQDLLDQPHSSVFHVEHGVISEYMVVGC